MQQIVVRSSSDLERVIQDLRRYNGDFRRIKDELCREQQRVDAMWDGQANTEFNNNFNRDKMQFENFAMAIDEYVRALEQIKRNYEEAETENTRTARDRRY